MEEKHDEFLRQILKVSKGKDLPAEVTTLYDKVKKLSDRKDVHITDQVLVLIAALAQPAEKIEEAIHTAAGLPCTVFYDGKTQDAVMLDKPSQTQGFACVSINGTEVEVPDNNIKLKE